MTHNLKKEAAWQRQVQSLDPFEELIHRRRGPRQTKCAGSLWLLREGKAWRWGCGRDQRGDFQQSRPVLTGTMYTIL